MRRRNISIVLLLCSIGVLILICDSAAAVSSAQSAIQLCLTTVIPSLFPMCVLTSVITNATIGKIIPFANILHRISGMPMGSESLLTAGMIGGYPLGAKLVAEFYEDGTLSKTQADWMLTFCSNAGPAFVFGLCGKLFTEPIAPLTIWSIQICSALMVARTFRCTNSEQVRISTRNNSLQNIIWGSTKAMGTICAWIILFRVIIGAVERWVFFMIPKDANILLKCILELTCGIVALPMIGNEQVRFIICSTALTLGGICIYMQTASLIGSLDKKSYIKGKLLQSAYSLFLAVCCIKIVYTSGAIHYFAPLFPIVLIFSAVFLQKAMAFSKTIIYNTRKIVRG